MKTKILSILALLLMTVTQGAWAQVTLTVYDGTADSQWIPMCGYYFDYQYTKCECIIPASELTAMEGGTITAITFYARNVGGTNTTFGTAKQKVFLKEVSETTLSSYSGMTGATVVFDGSLPMPTTSTDGYTISFSQGYTYNGGNLLIGVYKYAQGKANRVWWYGDNNQSSGVSAFGYDDDSPENVPVSPQTFLPKTTFTYTPANVGRVIGLDGKYYKTKEAAVNAGTQACAIIAYVGSETGEAGYTGGLAIAMRDANGGTAVQWKNANGTADNPNQYSNIANAISAKESGSSLSSGRTNSTTWPAFYHALNNTITTSSGISASKPTSGTSGWFLPSIYQWNIILKALSGESNNLSDTDNNNFKPAAVNVKIADNDARLGSYNYLSSTEIDNSRPWYWYADGGRAAGGLNKTHTAKVRAVFAFNTLTAAEYTVTYDANGGSGAPDAQTKDGGIDLTLSSTVPTRTGYTFAGWNTKADGSGTSYAAGGSYTTNDDIVLYAQWFAGEGTQGSWNYDYTGAVQSFTAPYEGTYTLEAWGAQGGNWVKTDRSPGVGGRGGYASGTVTLAKNQTIYIYVGGQGATTENQQSGGAGGWNGGGTGGNSVSSQGNYVGAGGGGGASHVSLSNAQVIGTDVTTLSGTNYLIVAGGGGGAVTWTATAGAGGGTEGGAGATTGGTSLSPWYNSTLSTGCNGYNAVDYSSFSAEGTGGGGGGYLGGNAGTVTSGTSNQDCGGCGGSSNYNSTYVSNFTTTSDVREGAGKVTITFLSGEGTEASPYLIASTTDWNNLVSAVNGGETYSGNYFKMTANVGTVSTWMTGTFSGTFDGDGNTLTVDYTATSQRCGAFGYLGSASIQNLKVAGTISTAYQAAGGLATWCNEGASAYITNCRVSTIISSSVSGDGTHGGFVAYTDGKLYFTGCVFDGSLTGSTTNACSGFVYNSGWNGAAVSLTDCLFAPSSVTIGTGASATFVRGTAPTITNCYYTQTFGTAQGLQARSISAGDYVSTLAISGDATTYDVSGITVYSTGISFNDGSTTTFYGGSGQTVSLDLTAETRDGYHFKQYAASQGSLSGETTDTPTLTMPAANSTANDVVTISAEYDPAPVSREIVGYGESTESDHWAFIASPVTGSITPNEVENIFSASQYDLYRFNQAPAATVNEEGTVYLEWENYKNATHTDGFKLVNGQGYLYATKETKILVFSGEFNTNATQDVTLTYSNSNPDSNMHGWNLVGNPFPVAATVTGRSYYVMNEAGTGVEPTAASAGTTIEACTGILVKAETTGESVTFTKTAPSGQPASNGLLQIAVANANTRSNAIEDKAVISFDEGDQLGKFYFGNPSANVYIPQNGKEYAIACSNGQGEMPINFKAKQNGQYTIAVNPEGVEMAYLHLIDNMTGADVDLLALRQAQGPATYTFNATTRDYESRFKLVFSSICEDANGDSETFAFFGNGSWIIANEGEATLQVIDLNGRILSSETVNGSVSKSINAVPGVYMIRLINGENVKVQKIVVR